MGLVMMLKLILIGRVKTRLCECNCNNLILQHTMRYARAALATSDTVSTGRRYLHVCIPVHVHDVFVFVVSPAPPARTVEQVSPSGQ